MISIFSLNKEAYGTKKSTGRPNALTPRYRRRIYFVASNNNTSSKKTINNIDLIVSKETVRKTLLVSGNIKYMSRKLELKLTKEHKKVRLNFAKDHMNWDHI